MLTEDIIESLPREVLAQLGDIAAPKPAEIRLAELEQAVTRMRDEAVAARQNSGIEDLWLDCEEAYLGIDDENRGEFVGARWVKSTTMAGPLTKKERRSNDSNSVRSTAFIRMTSRYVDAGTAKVMEISQPLDGKPFSIEPTPVPEMVALKNSKKPIVHKQFGPLMRDAKPGEAGAPPAPGNPMVGVGLEANAQKPPEPTGATVPLTEADIVEEAIARAKDAADKAGTRIYDWMIESKLSAQMRKVIHDAARLGTGILKGPFPTLTRTRATTKGDDGNITLQILEEVKPAYQWADLWNIYPDPACGDNIQNGRYICEVDYLTPKAVEDMLGNKFYLKGRVEQVLKAGPGRHRQLNDRPTDEMNKDDDGRYQAWYFYGRISQEDAEACIECGATSLKNSKSLSVIVTMINNIIVRVTPNTLESGEFCYHALKWSPRAGHWTGVGVAEQIRTPQRMLNAATRLMLTNASKSAGSQIVLDRSCVEPADKNWTLYPDKLWFKSADATVDDVRKAFWTFEMPNVQKEMMAIIEYAFRIAEETCNIPLISQGQSGDNTPETLGGQQLQDNNANQLLRSIAAELDNSITLPVVLQSYEWLLLDPDVPNDEKGDFKIHAQGSSAMVERYIQNQSIPMVVQLSANPIYGLDPKRTAKEALKAQKFDPRKFELTKEELEQLSKQPPPEDSRVTAAKIAAEATIKRAAMDTDRDTKYNESLAARDQIQAQSRRDELLLKRELAILEYANREKTTLVNVKAMLAKVAMEQRTKKELAAAEIELADRSGMYDRTHDKLKHDADLRVDSVEPRGNNGIDPTPSLVRDEVSTNVTP